MKIITVDIETYSPQNISEVGLFRYAQDPEFQVLLFGYVSEESDIPRVIDLTSWPDTKHFLREQKFTKSAGSARKMPENTFSF